ncbi:T9SS type A sorting domain-containing protein [Flammeovirga pectinis]|uniref:T9SS type A sorting domain-containing protein n=1 Tax=Flammeovirga pectinis TaxID=2494373 RepID=A0A3S9P6C7_9BACT|nr:T9SS type A sorting domain-containing protein [Flammeovirga pectinis]AZQ63761.1 T9SS type A sorting domain-containing protein [Flammeovirga pectinis]
MKFNKTILSIFSLAFLLGSNLLFAAVPTWTVNPNNYQYTMNVTAFVNVNGTDFTSTNDVVGAFVNDECRGVAQLVYVSAVNRHLAYITLYSNTITEDITFKVYHESSDTETTIQETLPFTINGNVGLPSSAYSIASPTLSSDATFNGVTFSNLNVDSITTVGDTVFVHTPFYNVDLSNVNPVFDVSVGAHIVYNNRFRGVSGNGYDLSERRAFKILSADQSTFTTIYIDVDNDKVTPSDFSNMMSFKGKLLTTGFRKNTEDYIAAFVGNECRGKAKLTYDSLEKDYFVDLHVYANIINEAIEFRIYTASNQTVSTVLKNVSFERNRVLGSTASPYIFSTSATSSNAEIERLSINGNLIRNVTYTQDTVFVELDFHRTDFTSVTPVFELSSGATLQYNGSSAATAGMAYDFSNSQEFVVVSQDGSATQSVQVVVAPEHVNAASFQHEMQVSSFVTINGEALDNITDKVAAFVNDEIRGVGSLVYSSDQERYVSDFTVYTNNLAETISFKVYSAEDDSVYNIDYNADFIDNGQLGESPYAYSIAYPRLNQSAIIAGVVIDGITDANVTISADSILVTIAESNASIAVFTPTFSISDGAKFLVNNEVAATSGATYDFSNPLAITVISEDEATITNYHLTMANGTVLSTVSSLEKAIVMYPNPIQNQLNVQTEFTIDGIKIRDINGRDISNNFTVNDNTITFTDNLRSGVYFVEILSDNTLVRKKIIKE